MTLDSMKIVKDLKFPYARHVPVNVGGEVYDDAVVVANNLQAEERPTSAVFSTSGVGFGSTGSSSSSGKRTTPISGFHACHAAPTKSPTYMTPAQLAERLNDYFTAEDLPHEAIVRQNGATMPPTSIAVCLEDFDCEVMMSDLTNRSKVQALIATRVDDRLLDYARNSGYDVIEIAAR